MNAGKPRGEVSRPSSAVPTNATNGPREIPLFNGVAKEAPFRERSAEREAFVRRTIEARGVRSQQVLTAMRRVPRHHFVPQGAEAEAYGDYPILIGKGQTTSQPYVVAYMTEQLALSPKDRCLEVGTGSGYQAAVLAEICSDVHSIEYRPELAAWAERNLLHLGYRVELRTGDGARGWPEKAPFDAIIVTAAPVEIPVALRQQLAVGGRLIAPVGDQDSVQRLERWTKNRDGAEPEAFTRDLLIDVRFVPFL